MAKVLVALFSLYIGSSSVSYSRAQTSTTTEENQYIFSFWGGYSFQSVRLFGKTRDAQSRILGLGMRKKIKSYPSGLDLYYTADFIPNVFYDYPKRDNDYRKTIRKGFGVSPVGFLIRNPVKNEVVVPYLQTTGSVVFISENFPTDNGTKLNYTFDITSGLSVMFSKHIALSFGYKFHHISNAQTGSENPGLDSNFIFISLSTF